MITGILRQFIFSLRSNFQMRDGFGFFTVQVVAIPKHVIFFAPAVIFIRQIKLQKLNSIFKLAQMKIRITQNPRHFRLLIGRHFIDYRRSIVNYLAVFSLLIVNLTDIKWNHFFENRIFLQLHEFLKGSFVIAFQVLNVTIIILCRSSIHRISFLNSGKVGCRNIHFLKFKIGISSQVMKMSYLIVA